jgi:hypothetical protein
LDLRNIFALLASNKDAAEIIFGKKVFTHDQYGNKDIAVLSIDPDDGNLVVTTKDDLE